MTTNIMIKLVTLYIFCIIFVFCEKLEDIHELEGEDGFYNKETPSNWVDLLFTIFMIGHHIYYAYKFTDYSLSHIHSAVDDKEKKKMAKEEKKKIKKEIKKKKRGYKKRKQPKKSNGSELKEAFERRKRRASKAAAKAEKAMKKAAVSKNFTTKSTSTTKKRSINNTVCCCIRCAPRYFTWHRTAIIRLFFRIYTSISCLLAMVLYMEFFMNLFVEFFITCIVHADQGYIAALILVPLMLYVIETLIRLSWHSVYVSWQINCDANGDFESIESDGNHHFNLTGDRFLYSYKIDAGDIEDAYNSSDFLDSSDSSETSSSSSSDESSSSQSDDTLAGFKNINSNSTIKKKLDGDLAVIEEEESNLLVIGSNENKKYLKQNKNKRSKSDLDKMDKNDENKYKKKQRSQTEDDIDYENERKIDREKEERRRMREDERAQRQELKLKIQREKEDAKQRRKKMREEQREQMGDYFIATCWRAWFCFGTIFAALIASYTVNVEIGVNGLFWQLVMRYCILGGLIWSVIYLFFAFLLCFMSRMMSWKLLHPNISRIKFFCLIDAKDHEKKNKKWRNCKILTMVSSLILFITFCIIGLILDFFFNNDSAGFALFIGIIFILYYFTNLFMSCKPWGLISLWSDTIPPPGKNFFAHLQVSEHLADAQHLKDSLKLNNRDNQIVHIGTNLELTTRENNENNNKNDNNEDVQNTKYVTRSKHTLSNDDIERISVRSGVSAYIPNLSISTMTPTTPATPGSVDDSPSSPGNPGTLTLTKSHQEFIADRVTALMNRYKKFKYIYKEPQNIKACCCKLWYLKLRLFWNNYKNYWLNVYRPFDEYDMETNLAATHILCGFQWIKPCLECRCAQKKSAKGKCAKCCAYLMDNTCNILLIIFFTAIIGTLFFFASQFGLNPTTITIETRTETDSISNVNNNQYYPVCSEYFGAESLSIINNDTISVRSDTDLSILDVLFLSQVVYEMDNFRIDEIIDKYFDNEYEIITAEYQVPFYFHMKHKDDINVNVEYLSIRGTAGIQEALQDISLFVEVALFEGLQSLVPFLYALPTSFVTRLIYYASLTEKLINSDVRHQFDDPIYEYLTDYLENRTTSIHLLGHSLGGGISSIVAANLFEDGFDSHISSFGVCSPGVLYSSAKFGFGVEALDKTSRSLLPRRDLVSKIDFHGGSVQYTDCKETSMLNCHIMPSVICEVYNNCPKKLAKKPDIFDCFCNDFQLYDGQQFGYCLNATQCQDEDCKII